MGIGKDDIRHLCHDPFKIAGLRFGFEARDADRNFVGAICVCNPLVRAQGRSLPPVGPGRDKGRSLPDRRSRRSRPDPGMCRKGEGGRARARNGHRHSPCTDPSFGRSASGAPPKRLAPQPTTRCSAPNSAVRVIHGGRLPGQDVVRKEGSVGMGSTQSKPCPGQKASPCRSPAIVQDAVKCLEAFTAS